MGDSLVRDSSPCILASPGPVNGAQAVSAGAHPLTMPGLAGMGDLVLTCTGMCRSSSLQYRMCCPEASALPAFNSSLSTSRSHLALLPPLLLVADASA